MKILQSEGRKNCHCFFCDETRSVKYLVRVFEPAVESKSHEVACCNKCAAMYVGKNPVVIHRLKILPKYFSDVCAGTKTFELRKNDRGFQVGDILELREWMPKSGYTGNAIRKVVTYILYGGVVGGLDESYVALAIK